MQMGQHMSSRRSMVEPDWEQLGIPVDDEAEPDDANADHTDEDEA
jgi:hypothetical protein